MFGPLFTFYRHANSGTCTVKENATQEEILDPEAAVEYKKKYDWLEKLTSCQVQSMGKNRCECEIRSKFGSTCTITHSNKN